MSTIGKDLIASMEEALAHVEGKATDMRVHAPAIAPLDMKKALNEDGGGDAARKARD